jgi:hypothetical protein
MKRLLVPLLGLVAFAAAPAPSLAPGSHTWDFTEVFSDASGTVQFMELRECCGNTNETGLPGHTVTSNASSLVIPGPALTPPTSNKHYLIATAAFAALPGAPTPDLIMPANFLSSGGDTLAYLPWDTWTFGALPTDGITSLQRNGSTGPNNPTNYAGTSGTIDASGPSPVPALPRGALIGLVAAAVLLGAGLLARRSI